MNKFKSILFGLGAGLFIVVGCSKKTAPTTTEEKPAYDGPAISYAKDVSPIIKRSCAPCHFPKEDGKKVALDTRETLKDELAEALKLVQLSPDDIHFMPYKKKKQSLSANEIEMLKNWARGGFME